MNGNELIQLEDIQTRIHTIRGVQVMLDSDLAELYGVEVKRLNEQVKRNIERFPESFCFQLNDSEMHILISQIVISNNKINLKSQIATSSWGGRRTNTYVFTEQGVAMLSAVLRSETAVKISVQIINAFVRMRRFIASNALIFQRLDTLETKQLVTDKKIDYVLNAIESKEIQLKQGIFFDGQIFDAYKFVADLIRTAQKSIILIDNYIDDSVLTILTKRRTNVKIILLTKSISNQMALDVKKYNEQYPAIEIREFKNSHDRFIIIDNTTVYHFGASLKDLGKKWFAFSKMDIGAIEMLGRLEGMK
ncbi:MAG: DNA-binding protein [Candidatus Methanoperedenaceae archaeon HGW-Methanoperedenaceae-1]|nr:MAG: DNA-binding protein [Candidatus Methanoperedenaceae archaeon HGW-Methanoperedenaceae-1]